jgi:hypothetical protein
MFAERAKRMDRRLGSPRFDHPADFYQALGANFAVTMSRAPLIDKEFRGQDIALDF